MSLDVAALLAGLERARTALAKRTADERIAALGRVVDRWLDDAARLEHASSEVASATGYAPAMVEVSLRRTFAAHRAPALASLLDDLASEPGTVLEPAPAIPPDGAPATTAITVRRVATAPKLVVAVLAQNTPGLAIAPTLQALALGSAIVLKPARGEPCFAARLVESIAEVDSELGAACAAIAWQGGTGEVEAALLGAASCVVAYGSAETIAALRARAGERVIAYGPRTSVAVVATAVSDSIPRIAASLARSVALLDQRGCLSPQSVLVDEGTDAESLAAALADELRRIEREWPRRRLDLAAAAAFRRAVDQAEAEMLAGRIRTLHGGAAEPWAVVLEREPALRASPLDRFVRLHPFAGPAALAGALAPLAGVLECVGLEAAPEDRPSLERVCRDAGAARICGIEAMQDPPASWHAGGRLPLRALLTWSTVEAPADAPVEPDRSPETPEDVLACEAAARRRFTRFVAQTSDSPRGIVVARARGSRVYDAAGRSYLDLLAGIGVAAIGHCHPAVVAAVREQMGRYAHVMVYGEDVLAPQIELAERLAARLPTRLSSVYLTSSGAEAIEGALKLVRKATGRSRVLAFAGAYHGDTTGALALGGNPFYREPFRPLLQPVDHLPWNDPGALTRIDGDVAGVFVEPVQAEAGVRIPDSTFLPALARRCREVGALLVYDEVVTGLGRTGRWFGLEHWPDAEPDVVVLAKALGGGLPLGAFIAAPETMRVLSANPPLGHITTFGGNPVACAASLATLEVLERDRLPARAADVGAELRARLEALVEPGRLAGVRGIGLLLGLELPSPEHTRRFVRQCLERRLLLGWTLHDDTIVRLAPPLTISDEDLDEAVAVIATTLRK